MSGGPRVVLTGASGGIGRATASLLRERGADVVGLDRRPHEGVIQADVRDQGSVDAGVTRALEQLGGLDVLINNAGIGDAQDTGAPPDERTLTIIDVNLLGAWRVTAAARQALLESGGRVVNVASGLAHLAVPFAAAYCMSKRGLTAFSDSLRLEYGRRITVTTVYPGYVRTAIHRDAEASGLSLEGVVPLERVDDAARAIARAALGRPRRDVATTRGGALRYALALHAPRALVDRVVERRLRRHVHSGAVDGSRLARGYRERLERASRRR